MCGCLPGVEAAEEAEIAETDFNAELAEIAENPSWKLLSVLCALGVSHRLCVLLWLRALQGAHCATSRFVAARVNSLRPANVVRHHGFAL